MIDYKTIFDEIRQHHKKERAINIKSLVAIAPHLLREVVLTAWYDYRDAVSAAENALDEALARAACQTIESEK